MQQPQPGEMIGGNYRIERILGRGGFATVYRAIDDVAGRVVAIKVLTPSADGYTREIVARFEREVRILAQLQNPYTVRMFDYGKTEAGVLYMVFEFVDGRDLLELLAERPQLESAEVRHILVQVLQSLGEAHGKGLLHRDIKPANIRVFRHDNDPLRVKVLDFGIARQAAKGDAPQITQAGELVGTPRYMSPEQLRFVDDLTPASDIYSLGVVAYEMLMGPASMHGNRLTDQVERVATPETFSLPPAIDPRLREVIAKMVAVELSDRFRSTAEVLAALGATTVRAASDLSNYVAPNHPAPLDEQTTKRFRRISLSMSVLAGLAVLATLVIWFQARDEDSVEPRPQRSEVANSLLKDNAPTPPPPPPEPTPAAATTPDLGEAEPVVWAPPVAPQRSSGCGRADVPRKVEDILGSTRKDSVEWVKKTYDSNKAYPVLILAHDTHETPRHLHGTAGFGKLIQQEDFIVIGPRGDPYDQALTPEAGIWDPPDAARVPGLIEVVGRHLCLDLGRVYGVGHGDGGDIITMLPCVLPGVRGIATVSYRPQRRLSCDVAVPYRHYTGKLDRNLPADGNGCAGQVMPLPDFEEAWRGRNGCGGEPVPIAGDDACMTWSCSAPFVSCQLAAGRGFADSSPRPRILWYGDPEGCDGPPPTRDLGKEIWTFFESI